VLSKFVIKGRFAIFGDLNQSILDAGVTKWEDISEVIEEAKHAQVYSLDTNYRSTKPIIDLANNILAPYTQNYLPKSINRKGELPKINVFTTEEDLLNNFQENIKKDINELNKSIGIICYSNELLESAKSIINNISNSVLDKNNFIVLESTSKIEYLPKAVYLTRFDNCKGLEFSKVYILGLNLSKVESFEQAKKAFVAVTRAMNEVDILGV
jgi:DNA helicase IV